ncbi:GNAT family N-acetyltransferase [uncultured Abyssibacter sp.]|uniref:GNAT family N-acetyltransferase n=1 Tax=uncultured Abyssibacter sp. TaxID=2320202 RepID=UPI0032B12DE4
MTDRAVVARTPRLLLREADASDVMFIHELVTQASWSRFIAPSGIETPDDARDYIRSRLTGRYAAQGFGLWLICERTSGAAIGMAGLVRRDGLPGPDLGFALLDAHVGRGYALEASRAVIEHAQAALGLTTLYAVVMPHNQRSLIVLSQLGFERHPELDAACADGLEVFSLSLVEG